MKANTYKKSIYREILSSKARFASILLIILLGTAFFSGVRSTSPDMKNLANKYYKDFNLMDSRVVSTLGLTEKDLDVLKDDDNILSYTGSKSFDINLNNMHNVVKFMSFNNEDNEKMNTLKVEEGRLPENKGEIALDKEVLKKAPDLKIGDTFKIEADEDSMNKFNTDEFTIVGFVNSPMYIEAGVRGTSSVGKGSVDYFAVVNSEDINMDVFTEVYVRFKNVENLDTYSDEYKDLMEENTENLKAAFKEREDLRVQEIKAEAQSKLQGPLEELNEGEAKLNSAEAEISSGKEQLEKGKLQYEEGLKEFQSKKLTGEAEISKGEKALAEGQKEINNKRKALEQGEDKLKEAKVKLDTAKQNLLSQGINPEEGTLKYEEQLKALEQIQSGGNTEVAPQIEKLKGLIAGISSYNSGKAEYDKNLAEITQGKDKLEQTQREINFKKVELTKAKKSLKDGESKLEESKRKLQESEEKLNSGSEEIAKNRATLEDGKRTIEEKQEEINKITGTYYYFDREDLSGFVGYGDATNSIKNIASFLPLFFFLVAVLICLTTMTRMVEEKRTEIGTLKALGYSDFEISKKYIVYAAIASIVGSTLGIVIGCNLFPRVISTAYSVLYDLGKVEIKFYPNYVIQALVISIVCTVGAALVVLRDELKNKPCDLMRPKAPKIGKKILLEKIPPLWKRLSFNQKVTLRNIFRYKQRMLMTVFGIAGCMAMLVLGFSLKASNDLIVKRQFGEIWNYDAMVIHNPNGTKADEEKYEEVLNSIDGFESSINIYQESVTLTKEGMNKQTALIYVPEDVEKFKDYVTLRNRKSKEVYDLTDDGVIINEKLANLLKVKAGDSIEFTDADNTTYTVKVSNISENYTGHGIYMSPKYYEEIFGKPVSYNAEFVKMDVEDSEKVSEELMNCEDVLNVSMIDTIAKSAEDSAESLKFVMIVIIVSAGSLAFIVLYNLNNINVSERIRELSTIKVLGFYDNEVTMYIVRENIILTILGILAGSVLGRFVYLYILKTAELDNMMMVHEVHMMRYVTAGLLTLLFSVIVMIMMHLKLKKVDMIDALKSIE